MGRFLPAMGMWDVAKAELPELDEHTPVILAMDAGESSDTFATLLISAHPTQPGCLAVRYVRPYVPDGAALDFDSIERDIRGLVERYAVQQIAYDPFLLGQMMRRLTNPDNPIPTICEPFPQGQARLEADHALYDLITQRRLAHDGDAALRAHLDNANVKKSADGRQWRIVKRRASLKIDLAVALSMGCARAAATLNDGWLLA